mgnify:CR=1 FL=1
MDTLDTFELTRDPTGQYEHACRIIEAIRDAASDNGPGCKVVNSDRDQVVVRAGVLTVFFRVVHGLPRSTFIQYGYLCRTPADAVAMKPVGEFHANFSPPPHLMDIAIYDRFSEAVSKVAQAVLERHGPDVRIRDGAVLETGPSSEGTIP